MSYISPDWIADEHVEYLSDKFDITTYQAAVDRKMNSVAEALLVSVDEIAVDESGHVTSLAFQEYGIILLKMKLLGGYWGKRNGSKDIYYQKMNELKSELSDAYRLLTGDNIKGVKPGDGGGDGFQNITQRPY